MTQLFQTWAKMHWRTDPVNNANATAEKMHQFIGTSADDIKKQVDYHIGHYGIVKCEIVTPKENENETQSTIQI